MTSGDSSRGRVDPRELRIGDADRNAAIEALGQHMATGRLTLDEYSSRSGQVTAARTAGDLQSLFTDLPAPHPSAALAIPSAAPLAAASSAAAPVPASPNSTTRAQQWAIGLSSVGGLIAVVLFLVLNNVWNQAWLVFLLIPISYGVATSVWGPGWRGDSGRDRNRDRRRR